VRIDIGNDNIALRDHGGVVRHVAVEGTSTSLSFKVLVKDRGGKRGEIAVPSLWVLARDSHCEVIDVIPPFNTSAAWDRQVLGEGLPALGHIDFKYAI